MTARELWAMLLSSHNGGEQGGQQWKEPQVRDYIYGQFHTGNVEPRRASRARRRGATSAHR